MEEMGDENMRECDGLDGRGTEWERNEREILIERATVYLGRNLVLGKFQKSTTVITAKTPSSSEGGS